MKKLLIILLFIPIISVGQVTRYRATSMAYREAVNGTLPAWPELKPSTVLIVLDDALKITIYGKTTIVLSQISDVKKFVDKDGDSQQEIQAIDENGNKCWITLVTIHSQDDREQLYISYPDWQVYYNLASQD